MFSVTIIKFIRKYKNIIAKLFSFFPLSFQKNLKVYYRSYTNSVLYERPFDSQKESNRKYSKNVYSLPEKIDPHLAKGINLVGFPTCEFGLAEHLRSVGNAVDALKILHLYYDCSSYIMTQGNDLSRNDKIKDELEFNTSIFVCNGDLMALIFADQGQKFFNKKYNIHYGAWELSDYPKEWIPTLGLFDEYWAMSSFLQKSVSDIATIPVLHMPYPVDFVIPKQFTRKDYNLPEDKFLFIFTFDMSSIMERKNPKAVVEAFYQAFPQNNDVGLVIKVMSKPNLTSQKQELSQLMNKLLNDKRVFLIDEILTREKMLGLINVCDVYVSLHRAEGLGIGMAEAMKMQKPVIATNYSGNTDFTLHNNSCLVDYKLVPLNKLDYIYEDGKVWADANVEHAAYYMKKLFDDRAYYDSISIKGKEFIDENYSISKVAEKYKARLKILGLLN